MNTYRILCAVSLVIGLFGSLAGVAYADEGNRYVNAVRAYADNVLKHGKDVYGKKHTPLFVDGLNIHTREPVKWKRKGQEWTLSNLASQQNLFRTLDGLSKVTKDPKYRQAAVEAIRYAFKNLRSPNGLLYWGGHVAYDAQADKLVMEQYQHELKTHYPYYALMWEVDPKAAKQFIEGFWEAHILDWSNLDMNRHGSFGKKVGKLWEREYKGGKVFFVGRGLTFCNTGSDLIYAGAMLHKFTGEKGPLTWAKRLAYRYVETRNPKTGLGGYQYSQVKHDRAQKQFGPEFGKYALEGTILSYYTGGCRYAVMGICQLQLGQMLGEAGKEFQRWALEDLTAYGKHAYNPKDNTVTSMFTDGRKISLDDVKRDGYYNRGLFVPREIDTRFFWAYALAFRLSDDAFHWQMARNIGKGYDLGDIGEPPAGKAALNLRTKCSDPYVLLGLLEFHRKTGKAAFLDLAKKIGDNILAKRFHKGFFVQSKKHIYAKFDALEPLVLLHLAAIIDGKQELVPQARPGRSYFHCPYDGKGRTYDNVVIYSQTIP